MSMELKKQDSEIVEIAYGKSVETLRRQVRQDGMVAAGEGYYPCLTTRDIMITYLGAALVADPAFKASYRASLDTLACCQSPSGQIPNIYFFPDGLRLELNRYAKEAGLDPFEGMDMNSADYSSGLGGSIDAAPFYTLGRWYHFKTTQDLEFLRKGFPVLKKSLSWLSYQDSNNCGLLEVQEASDWADIFPNRYNSLMANVLYYAQLKCMADIAGRLGEESAEYEDTANNVKRKINLLLWVSHDVHHREEMLKAHRTWFRVAGEFLNQPEHPYYLPYASFLEVGEYMDVFANLLAIIFGVADRSRADMILDHIEKAGINKPFPIRAIDPPIRQEDRDWRPYMLLGQQNLPYQYHNGGIWPFIGGFYVAALVKSGRTDDASKALIELANLNKLGEGKEEWQLKEWVNGATGEVPAGSGSWMAWNAGMYLYAYHSVKTGSLPVFGELF